MPLCTLCESLPPLEDLGAFKHRTYQELHALSKSQQCDLCSMIWQTLVGLGSTEKILAEEPDKISVILEYQGSAAWDSILVSPDLPTSAGSTIELFTMRGERIQKSITKKGTAPSHKSPETYQFIRETIQDCVSNHKQCFKNIDVELPTFLVDVGTSHDRENVRLVRNDDTSRGTYLALSYCWGGPQRVMLTKKTLAPFQDQLAENTLPEALRDAVHVTRELGHRYIWIDALCIVQDDEAFKQLELRKMNRIYQNAFLTIQPTSSASVENGFLEGRKTTPHVKTVLQQNADGTRPHVYARSTTAGAGENRGPTTQRAWIFQETALSMRIVAYNSRQVTVGCRTHLQLESGGTSQSYFFGPGMHKIVRPDLYASAPRDARAAALTGWYKTIALHYSNRLYTVGKDRLYALSAFAEEAQQLVGGEYLAGLWSVDLIRGLGWRPGKWRVLGKPAQYRAPSWSWAAYDGPTFWFEPERNRDHIKASVEPRVVDAWIKLEGINPYGACLDGKITLQTLVGTASLSQNVPVYKGMPVYKGSFIMTTADGAQSLCEACFDTPEQPESFTCAFLAVTRGLLLVAHGSGFRRIGAFMFGSHFMKTNGVLGFQTWIESCKEQTITIV
ncbi:heterokaryon incompatibility protein-domain-containing protein [Pestalotiopsis sp. NC0098]|nr:heterokaryon incompatibility protein-domain-containing protein [Pestalotiopsis sp. NC0098]